MSCKYIILDFGKVIAAPATGNWDITPKFLELIDTDKMNMEEFKNLRTKYQDILSENITTLEEEYDMFFRFYNGILSNLNYSEDISKKIAYDRTYSFEKYTLYDNVQEELDILKEKYHLILLTDNWPSVIDYLNEYKLYSYFDKIYVSSVYGVEKKDKVFFDYPIKDFELNPSEVLFIDDYELNLDIAKEKGFRVKLMDRKKEVKTSNHKIINNLLDI